METMQIYPKKFLFESGGFASRETKIEWRGNELHFCQNEPGEFNESALEVIVPSKEQWSAFQLGLEDIGALLWKQKYEDKHVVDGCFINILISFNITIKCNCYHLEPPNFSLFLDLINTLTKTGPSDNDLITELF